ncbi:ACT domain-containing protein [Intrasporangium sp.]|uniref:ACT domain-containing protein n=1 Tax=Intrasporangium sp. TaxID=1925024 RepID=UPI0026471D45|nr:ACT domain-containing protein [Intrasporangium sp.]
MARVAPELIERLGRVLRHRGALVERLTFEACASEAVLHADVRCAAPVEVIVAQLERLPDVHSVRAS